MLVYSTLCVCSMQGIPSICALFSLLWSPAAGEHTDPWSEPEQMVLWLFLTGGFLQSLQRESQAHLRAAKIN